jgi:hypothetical protein
MRSPFLFPIYSREDSDVVYRICQLLRAGVSLDSADEDSIESGKRWNAVLTEARENCDCVLVFWSAHSATSSSVRQRYSHSIRYRQEVVPVLLDDTPLVEELCPCRSLDCRPFVTPSDESRARLVELLARWVFEEVEPG